MAEKIHCPECNSSKIARFLYGLPMFSAKLDKQIKNGEVIIGGCVIRPGSPDYRCRDCGREFKEKGGGK